MWNQDGRWCVPQIFQRLFRPRHWLPGRVTPVRDPTPRPGLGRLDEAQKSFPNSPPPNSCWKDDTKYIIDLPWPPKMKKINNADRGWGTPIWILVSGDPTRRGRDGLENDWWLNAWVSMDHCNPWPCSDVCWFNFTPLTIYRHISSYIYHKPWVLVN